jgi:phenylpyruvate tautomerase PptA (4-oxalocrotonate tautomerase family)
VKPAEREGTEHDAANFRYSPTYLGVARSDDLLLIQISVRRTRTVAQKKALYGRVADLLAENPGVRREDVFVNLLEGEKENWSFGDGLAQYA